MLPARVNSDASQMVTDVRCSPFGEHDSLAWRVWWENQRAVHAVARAFFATAARDQLFSLPLLLPALPMCRSHSRTLSP